MARLPESGTDRSGDIVPEQQMAKQRRRSRERRNQKIMKDSYEDITDLPHPTSKKHERMSRMNRAAQFAPFSALTGLGRALKQTADKNEEKWEMEYGEEDETDIMDDP